MAFMSSPQEVLTFKMMILGCRAFMRYLYHDVEPLGTELEAEKKTIPESSFAAFLGRTACVWGENPH